MSKFKSVVDGERKRLMRVRESLLKNRAAVEAKIGQVDFELAALVAYDKAAEVKKPAAKKPAAKKPAARKPAAKKTAAKKPAA
ncbi:MAG: hypothetical protein AAF811_17290, partial [Pseudomonadota bacterium]